MVAEKKTPKKEKWKKCKCGARIEKDKRRCFECFQESYRNPKHKIAWDLDGTIIE